MPLAEAVAPGIEGYAVGGGSDGNFTAAIGVPTLDGLGAVGGGAHADHEYVVVDTMPDRARLIAGLVEQICAADTWLRGSAHRTVDPSRRGKRQRRGGPSPTLIAALRPAVRARNRVSGRGRG